MAGDGIHPGDTAGVKRSVSKEVVLNGSWLYVGELNVLISKFVISGC